MTLYSAIIAALILQQLLRNRPADAGAFATVWLPFAAAVISAAGIIPLNGRCDFVLAVHEARATWVPCLFYGSWLLWAIAAGGATRSYQLHSAGSVQVIADKSVA